MNEKQIILDFLNWYERKNDQTISLDESEPNMIKTPTEEDVEAYMKSPKVEINCPQSTEGFLQYFFQNSTFEPVTE